MTAANRDLAAHARQLAAAAPRGSLDRKAAGCAAVALAESKTIDGARRVLALLWQADVRQAAEQLVGQLGEYHDLPATQER
jgi:hypothetical protein